MLRYYVMMYVSYLIVVIGFIIYYRDRVFQYQMLQFILG